MTRLGTASIFTLLTATLVALLVSLPVVAQSLPPGGTFVDDDGNTHEGNIEAIAAAGITKGCNPPVNDRYCPNDPVTRGQMAAFLVRALDLTDDGGGTTFVDDDGNTFEADIATLAAAGITKGCNPPTNDRYCPNDPVTRGQMASFLARALDLTPIIPPPRPVASLQTVATGLSGPVYVTSPTGDPRVFIVEKAGRVRIVEDGTLLSVPFLDISSRVQDSGEKGLLSIAFHPDYATNGRFYVYYSGPTRPGAPSGTNHTSYISEFTASADPDVADVAGERVVLAVDQPASNHNGGQLLFGPDGMLYVGLGDGGGANDTYHNGQDPDTLLGTVLRIDVDGATPYGIPADNPFVGGVGADEVWVYGLRNPWRFWFDGGYLYIADVGQSAEEEIDVVAADQGGVNFGWSRYEGDICNPDDSDPSCATSGLTFPILTYSHGEGCSITGGVVYRGSELPQLDGYYLYGDLCSGFIRGIRQSGGMITDTIDLTDDLGTVGGLWSFGTDADGEVYVVAGSAGIVYRMVGTP